MTASFRKLTCISVAVIFLLAACGGGSTFLAGISGTGITSEGAVTSFGSVFVNGVEFNTDKAKIMVNGERATEAELQVGGVVTVTGALETKTEGIANTVVFDRDMHGPIDAIDRVQGVLTALGQTWHVNESTVFADTTLVELAERDLIAASGFMAGKNTMVATLVQLSDESPTVESPLELEGIASNLNLNTASFNIGRLLIDYRSASLDERAGALANGTPVEIIGTQGRESSVFHAQNIRVMDHTLGSPGRYVELEGIVTGLNGRDSFSINGHRVDTSVARQTDDTGLALANGIRVEVEGRISEHGVLIAERFSIKPPSKFSFMGTINSVNTDNSRLTIYGIPIAAEPAITRYQDLSAMSNRALRLNGLWPGDYVSVRAYSDDAGELVATHIQRQDLRARATVSGAPGLCGASDNKLVIAGIIIHTAADTKYTNRNGKRADMASFCSALEGANSVEAKGIQVENALYASEIRLAE